MKFGLREMIFVVVMLGLLGSSYFLVFSKANAKRDALDAEIVKKNKELADLNRSTMGAAQMRDKVDKVQQAVALFEDKLPREREIAEFVRQVSRLAASNNLATHTLKSEKSQKTGNHSEQAITLGFSGDFKSFYKFLQQVESLARLHRVMDMTLKKIDSEEGAMTADLTLCIFHEPGAPDPAGNKQGQGGSVTDAR